VSKEKKGAKSAKKASKEEAVEKGVLGVTLPSLEEVKDFIRTVKVVTPSVLSERFKLRVSVAKDLLSKLASEGLLKPVVGVNRIRVYMPLVEAAPSASAKQEPTAAKPAKAKKAKASKQSSA